MAQRNGHGKTQSNFSFRESLSGLLAVNRTVCMGVGIHNGERVADSGPIR
jgi:hypothetical protein